MKEKAYFIVSFFCLVVLIFLVACNRQNTKEDTSGEGVASSKTKVPPSRLSPTTTLTPDATSPQLPTEQEAILFAQNLESSLKTGDASTFTRAIDWSTLTDRVLAGIPASEQARFDRRYLLQLFSEKDGLAQSVAEKIRKGGSYHFLRVRKTNAQTLAVTFRLIDPDGGLDYHDLHLQRHGQNLIQIEEFYLYHFDETFSETLRRTLVPNLYPGGQNDYGMMMSENLLFIFRENQLLIQEFSRVAEEKNARRALDLFEQLPQALQNQKTFQFWRLQVAQAHPDEHVYAFILADVRARYQKEAWADFLSLDYFFNCRDFPAALACLERIDKRVGGDPYLESFRCWALLNLGKHDEAKKRYDLALTQEPELAKNPSFISLCQRLEALKKKTIQPLNPFRM